MNMGIKLRCLASEISHLVPIEGAVDGNSKFLGKAHMWVAMIDASYFALDMFC